MDARDGSKMAPRAAEEDPRRPQEVQEGAKRRQEEPRGAQGGPETVPRRPQVDSKSPRPLNRGLCKSGVRFSAPFLGPRLINLMWRGRIRGPPGGPSFFFPAIFLKFFSLHCCLGPGFGPGRAWSREPSCRDLARGIPRLFPRSACRRKPAAWLPRCGARALNPQALKP